MKEMIFEHHVRFAESFPELASSSEYSPPEMPAREFDKTKLDEAIAPSVKEGMQFVVDVLTSAVLNRKENLSDDECNHLRNLRNRVSEIQNYTDAVDLIDKLSDTVTHRYFDVDGNSTRIKSI